MRLAKVAIQQRVQQVIAAMRRRRLVSTKEKNVLLVLKKQIVRLNVGKRDQMIRQQLQSKSVVSTGKIKMVQVFGRGTQQVIHVAVRKD